MKPAMLTVVSALALLAAFGGGYIVASERAKAERQSVIADVIVSNIIVGIERDLRLLTFGREKKPFNWVKELELRTVIQLQYIDPSTYVKGSVADRVYPETMEMLNAYRQRYPDTAIDPAKDPSIAKAFGPGQ